MTTTISWTINELERQTANGIVYTVHYRVNAADGTYSAGAYGSVGLEPPSEGDIVIPFTNLTEAIVVGWVKTTLGDERVDEIEAALQGQIDEQRAPSRATGIPW